MSFVCGFLLGFFVGSTAIWNYFRKRPVKRVTVNMDALEAAKYIESDEAVKKLKKEINIK